jgi:hypothetical protein
MDKTLLSADRVSNLTQVIITKSKQNLASNLLNTYYTTPNKRPTKAQSQIPYNYSICCIEAGSPTSSFFLKGFKKNI